MKQKSIKSNIFQNQTHDTGDPNDTFTYTPSRVDKLLELRWDNGNKINSKCEEFSDIRNSLKKHISELGFKFKIVPDEKKWENTVFI